MFPSKFFVLSFCTLALIYIQADAFPSDTSSGSSSDDNMLEEKIESANKNVAEAARDAVKDTKGEDGFKGIVQNIVAQLYNEGLSGIDTVVNAVGDGLAQGLGRAFGDMQKVANGNGDPTSVFVKGLDDIGNLADKEAKKVIDAVAETLDKMIDTFNDAKSKLEHANLQELLN